MRLLWTTLLVLAAGCSRPGSSSAHRAGGAVSPSLEQPPLGEEPAPDFARAPTANEGSATEHPDATAREGAKPAQAGGAEEGGQPAASGELKVGMSREELLRRLGPCGHRVLLMTASALPAEVFQPEEGDCVQRFGERQFFVVGERLERIEPGLSHYVPPHPVQTDQPD